MKKKKVEFSAKVGVHSGRIQYKTDLKSMLLQFEYKQSVLQASDIVNSLILSMNFFGIFLPRLAGNMAEYDHVTNKLACYLSWRGYTCKQLIRHTEIPASLQSHDQVSFSPQALFSPLHITILFSTLHLTIHAVVIASLVTYRLVWI